MIEQDARNKLGSIFLVLVLTTSGLLMVMQSISESDLVSATSTWTQSSDADFQNGIFSNVITNGSGTAAVLELASFGASKWIDKTPTPRPTGYPSPRYDHQMESIATTDKVLMFGDFITKDNRNESWVYDLSDNNWTLLQPTNNPHLMRYPKIASVRTDDKIVLFGGCGFSGKDNNETWVYDYSDNAWQNKSLLNPTPTTYPPTRYVCGLTSISGTDKVLLFGGKCQSTKYSDVWIYDVSENTWIEKKPTGNNPGFMSYIDLSPIDGIDKVLLYGGDASTPNETWIFDLSDNKWAQMMSLPCDLKYPEIAPVYGTDNIFLFGGFKEWYANETWMFDLDGGPNGSWTNITNITPLATRYRHGMAPVYNTNLVVLFGGAIGQAPWSGDETWIFKYSRNAKNGSYVSEPYDTGANSTFNSISWNANIPSNTMVRIQLRTALDSENLSSSEFLGPDGTTTTFYTTPAEIWPGHFGHRWIQYNIYLNTSNVSTSPSLEDLVITFNCIPITIPQGPQNEGTLDTNEPIFRWIFSDHDSTMQQAFQVFIDDDPIFKSVDYDSGIVITTYQAWEFPYSLIFNDDPLLPDGVWYWKVRTQDTDSQWSEFSETWKIIIDTAPPNSKLTTPVNNGFYNNLDTITGTANDGFGGSGVEKVEINIKLQNYLFWDGYDWGYTQTWLAVNGINDWTYDSSNFPWISGNIYQIQSRATDHATNVEQPGTMIEVHIDKDFPTTMISTPIDNKWFNNLDNISGSAMDISGAGINNVQVSILQVKSNNTWGGSQWTTGEYWLIASGTKQWYYNTSVVPWKTGNQYVIKTRATDNVKNIETPGQSVTFWFDDTQPDYLEIVVNNNDEYTTELEATLSLEAYDMGSGVSHMSFSFYGYEDSWSAWEPFNKTKALMLTLNDGEKSIYFRVKDHAENIAEPKYDKIILDTTPPEKLAIVINEDVKYTNSDLVTLALHAYDETSGLDLMAFSFDVESWENEEEFEDSKIVKVPPGDGQKIIYFKLTDKAGNTAGFVNDSIILDTTAPQALSMEIVKSSKGSDSISIELKLTATDYLSGVDSMSFSFDNKTWSSWEAFTEVRTFFLTLTDNERTIYYRVSDVVGNVATPASLVIPQINDQAEEKNNERIENSSQNITIAVIIFMIILILSIIVITQIISKRQKKRAEQKVLATKPITRKPNGFNPVTGFQKFNGLPQPVIGNINLNFGQKSILNQLPVTSTTNMPGVGVVPTIPVIQTPIATMPAPVTTPKPMPWVPMKPQLPPAKENTS